MICLRKLTLLLSLALPCLNSLAAELVQSDIILKPSEMPGGEMTLEKYRAYINLFNHKDPRFADYYHDTMVFKRSEDEVLIGRDAVKAFYADAWTRIDERVWEDAIAIDNKNGVMAVDLSVELLAKQDPTPDASIRLKKGDHLLLREVLFYKLKDGLITSLDAPDNYRIMTPANGAPLPVNEVTESIPPLQRESLEAAYAKYADCFNRQIVECFSDFYNPDIKFISEVLPTMHSTEEIVNFYLPVWKHLKENLVIHGFRYEGKWMYVQVSNTLTVFEDYPDFVAGPLKKGDRTISGEVAYEIKNGRFAAVYDGIDPAKMQ